MKLAIRAALLYHVNDNFVVTVFYSVYSNSRYSKSLPAVHRCTNVPFVVLPKIIPACRLFVFRKFTLCFYSFYRTMLCYVMYYVEWSLSQVSFLVYLEVVSSLFAAGQKIFNLLHSIRSGRITRQSLF